MNILYLAHRVPFPPDKGDKLRAFRQLAHLGRRHRVWCACFVDTPDDAGHVEPLEDHCVRVTAVALDRKRAKLRGLWSLLRGSTFTEGFYHHDAMREALDRLTETVAFDVIVAFSSSMAPYALSLPAKRRVLDLCDLDSQKWLAYAQRSGPVAGLLYRVEGNRLAIKERYWLSAFDATILITEAEAAAIDAPTGREKLHIVGNGVPSPDIDSPGRGADDDRNGARLPTVGFVGQMDYRPNVDAVCRFVRDCWPAIRTACPEAAFRIVGRSPARAVRKLGRAVGVEVVGAVDDVTREVLRFDVSVAPMRIAQGLQNKVLEAMAAARPVVLTSRAAEGIAARTGREFLVADDVRNLAGCVVRLLRDKSLRTRMGQLARAFVATHHRWDRELAKFERIVTGQTGSDEDVPATEEAPTAVREPLHTPSIP